MLLGKMLRKIIGSKLSEFLFSSSTSNKSYPFSKNFNPKFFTVAEKFSSKVDPSKKLKSDECPVTNAMFFLRTTEM
jgi:hypothetical protein